MTTIALKKYIYDNEKVEYVLEEIGCHDIVYHQNKKYWSCANFDGDNKTAINVKNNEYLNVRNWTREKYFDSHSDIITLVEYNKNCSFIEAVKYLHDILGLDYKYIKNKKKSKEDEKKDPLYIFKKIKRSTRNIDVEDVHVLDEKVLNDFVPLLYIGWFREGVMPWTRKKFGLAYSYKYKRVIIPHRFWLTGELVGINARTVVENYDVFGISKYHITPSYQKHLNIYGLYENYDAIQKAGYVVVMESEKSVLKRDSLFDATCVALSGKYISDEQVSILIGLNVNIIISMDNDVNINEIRFMCEKFFRIRNVYYTKDKWNLLDEKDSIADKSNKVFKFLMEHKIKYTENEHKKYLKSLKE